MIHQFDPRRASDDQFDPGMLSHLVPGNRGRLLDPRRTPMVIVALELPTGHFIVRIEAFEDRGAEWHMPLEAVGSVPWPTWS